MSLILDGSAGITFPNSTLQASAGAVLQVVRATSTSTYSVLGGPVSTGITASITPKFSTSKILIIINCRLYIATQGEMILSVYRGGSSIQANYTLYSSASNMAQLVSQVAYDSPATTSSTTYTLYIASANTTGYINPNGAGDGTSSITLMEIAG